MYGILSVALASILTGRFVSRVHRPILPTIDDHLPVGFGGASKWRDFFLANVDPKREIYLSMLHAMMQQEIQF